MDRPSRWWNWAGLIAAGAVYTVAVLTLGFGLLLSPVALAISVWSFRRVPPPRGVLVWAGLAVNALLTLATLFLLAAFAVGSETD